MINSPEDTPMAMETTPGLNTLLKGSASGRAWCKYPRQVVARDLLGDPTDLGRHCYLSSSRTLVHVPLSPRTSPWVQTPCSLLHYRSATQVGLYLFAKHQPERRDRDNVGDDA
jgi:hypothetical protein